MSHIQHPLGILEAPAWHRPWFRYVEPVDGAEAGNMPPTPSEKSGSTGEGGDGAKPEEPLGAPGLSALQSEREARKTADKKLADALAKIQQFEDRDKTEAQRQQDALDRAKKELATVTVAKTRAEVAAAKGVPVTLLTGDTQEEIEASAEALLQFKGTEPQPPAPEPQRYVIPDEAGVPAIGKHDSITPGMGTLRAAYAEATSRKK